MMKQWRTLEFGQRDLELIIQNKFDDRIFLSRVDIFILTKAGPGNTDDTTLD